MIVIACMQTASISRLCDVLHRKLLHVFVTCCVPRPHQAMAGQNPKRRKTDEDMNKLFEEVAEQGLAVQLPEDTISDPMKLSEQCSLLRGKINQGHLPTPLNASIPEHSAAVLLPAFVWPIELSRKKYLTQEKAALPHLQRKPPPFGA